MGETTHNFDQLEKLIENKSSGASTADDLVACTAQIVSAYTINTPVNNFDLIELIDSVYAKLSNLHSSKAIVSDFRPAVPIEESVTEDYIVCLEDGKKFKMLKKHLMSIYGLTPAEYRRKWGLPADYPMTAPSYARRRQELAKEIGLGQNRR